MNIIKIVKSPENDSLLIKGVTETVQKEAKEQNGGFLSMLAAMLTSSLLGSMLSDRGVIRAGKGTIRAGQGF